MFCKDGLLCARCLTVAVKPQNGVTKHLCKILSVYKKIRQVYVYWHKNLPCRSQREREREREIFYLMVLSVVKIIEH
jgi:hypothetical protein